MAIDLIFSQPVARHPAAASRGDQIGPSGSDRSAGIRTFPESPESDRDNFLSTLEQVTQDRNPARQPEPAAASRLTKSSAGVAGGQIDDASGHEPAPVENPVSTKPDQPPEPAPTEWNLTAFIKLLESLGFNHATDDTLGLPTGADANPADKNLLTAIESLIARLQQHQIGMAADLKAGLEQLQQFIDTALGTADGASGQGRSPGQISELSQIHQWLTGLTAGSQAQKAN